jgi:alkanesulfonate monooxygenase SsuD/methylene tetrahydromethanopterin reductase-like flavin-dependent oxidoreductase (luciferase family)
LACTVIGSAESVREGLEAFVQRTGADELMIASQIFDFGARLRSYEITAGVREPVAAR